MSPKKQFLLKAIGFLTLSITISCGSLSAGGKKTSDEGAISKMVAGFKKYPGYFDFYWDQSTGSIFLEVDRFEEEFLYLYGLAAGVGSNDLGLDRGQLARERVMKFVRSGPKVLLVQPNYDYRATTENPLEQRAVDEAFATSVWWGFQVVAEEEGRVLINITDFLIRDSHGVVQRLAYFDQGSYRVDPSRSAIFLERTKNFPQNSEFEAIVTLTGTAKGRYIQSVTPYADAVTVRNHHSFIKLPEGGFSERDYDIRSGFGYISYQDFGTDITEPLVRRKIIRHRLEKNDPLKDVDQVKEPIVYYLDQGAPEPIRSALLEGASWWAEAFEQAGFKNGFRVELLPDTVDPLDIRYNVIQWVHRSTRGWSYGNSVTDPRTGEIIKGHVSLGSQRVRQDFMIAVGLLGPYDGGDPTVAREMALARLRQLSAHEVGHTLGLMHNFAASYNNRASVMDYPHPLFKLNENGDVDLSGAYDTGVGEWDLWAIKYGYNESSDPASLNAIIKERDRSGLLYITDRDARPLGGAHPYAHLWDNNANPKEELDRVLKIRRILLDDFDLDRVAPGEPVSTIEDVLVPIYYMHRYQLEANSKLIGGLEYHYSVKGDGLPSPQKIDPKLQKEAIESMVDCLKPENLGLPENLVEMIPPRPPGYGRGRENFPSRTGVMFDPLAAAENLSDRILEILFHPQRLARMEQFAAEDKEYPSFEYAVSRVRANTWEQPRRKGKEGLIQRIVELKLLYRLMAISNDPNASGYVREVAFDQVVNFPAGYGRNLTDDHLKFINHEIERFKSNPSEFEIPDSPKMPDGSPIGMDCLFD